METKELNRIIVCGIGGKKGYGKNTAAKLDWLRFNEELGFPVRIEELAFANPLKDAVEVLCNFTWEQLHTEEGKDTVDARYGKTPRDFLKAIGCDAVRKLVNKDFFLIRLKDEFDRLRKPSNGVLIVFVTDVRYDNEVEFIQKELNGVVIKLIRSSLEQGEQTDTHDSEAGLTKYDHLIYNDSTVDELHAKVKSILWEFRLGEIDSREKSKKLKRAS